MTISNGTYIIRSVHSQAHRLHKDDESSAIVNDTANDTWIVTKNVAGGFYTITHNHSTPEACLDLAGQNTTPGTDIIVHPKNSSKAQEWEITEVTAGFVASNRVPTGDFWYQYANSYVTLVSTILYTTRTITVRWLPGGLASRIATSPC